MAKKWITFVAVTLLLTAPMTCCTAPMDINVHGVDSRLVIYATLMDTADSQCVYVQRTMPVFSTEQDSWVYDARVSISTSEAEVYQTQWSHDKRCYIVTKKLEVKPEVTYTLNVYYDMDKDGDLEYYTASTTPIEPLKLDYIKVEPLIIMKEKMYRLAIFGKEPEGPNHYVFRVGVNGNIKKHQLKDWMIVDDKLFEGNDFRDFTLGMFMSKSNDDSSNIFFTPGDNVSLYLANIDKDFMNFALESQRSGNPSNPFFGTPPFNMRSNISNGALGYFGSLCSSAVHTKVPQDVASDLPFK